MSKKHWITPVYDRTFQDVEYARKKIKEWTEEETSTVYELKGCLNVSDLNRIENNIEFLAETLSEFRYIDGLQCKEWEIEDIVLLDDVKRILDNLRTMVENFHKPIKDKDVPYSMSRYHEINDVEEILKGIYDLLVNLYSCFQYSDTFQSGSRRILPLIRR